MLFLKIYLVFVLFLYVMAFPWVLMAWATLVCIYYELIIFNFFRKTELSLFKTLGPEDFDSSLP